jgi:hypothetical protein
LNRIAPFNYVNEKWVWRHEASETPVRVQKLLGAFLFVRREVFQQVGLFDEGYFLFSEEEDFCYRIFKQVLRIGLVLLSPNSQRSEMIKAYLRAIAALFQPLAF